jgi:hypothetical protein
MQDSALSATAASMANTSADISPAEARAIAREATIYGFPMVDSYRIQYAYFVDKQNAEYKGPWNQLHNFSRVYTPEDRTCGQHGLPARRGLSCYHRASHSGDRLSSSR